MAHDVVLNSTTHTLPTRKEVGWTTAVNNFFADVGLLLNGTFQTVTATGAATTIELEDGHNITLNLNASTTVTLSGGRTGERYVFFVVQGGSYTLSWSDTIRWPSGGTVPVVTTGAGALDIVTVVKHPTLGYSGTYQKDYR